MNTTTHLAELLTMTQVDFGRYVESINQIALLRRNLESAAPAPPPHVAEPPSLPSAASEPIPKPTLVPTVVPKRLAARPPMKAAKAGTLRGEIHEVLRSSGKPLRRAEIIAAVGSRRGCAVDDVFKGKVSDILANPHDLYIERTGHGVYQFSPSPAPAP
jgi:hypothetical protein